MIDSTQTMQVRRTMRSRSPWPSFLARRLGSFIFSLWLIATLVFFMSYALGGDAVLAAAGLNSSPEFIAARRAELGLDDPILVQYWRFLGHLVTLDFGASIATGESVNSMIASRFPFTLQLGLSAFMLAALIGIPAGIGIAFRTQGGKGKRQMAAFNGITGFFSSIPDFLIAVTLVAVVAIGLRWLPAAGAETPASYILPVITISIGLIAFIARIVRTEASRVLQEEYIRTARSMQLKNSTIVLKYVLPNVLTATITYAGLLLAGLLGGTIIAETVFAWPGIGSLMVNAIVGFDYPLLEGIVVLIAALSLLITFIVDIILALVDPRSLIVRS